MSTSAPRVVVTGIGVVSALGCSSEEHFRRLFAGESGVTAGSDPASRARGSMAGARVQLRTVRRKVGQRMLRKVLQPSALSAVAAAAEALAGARLEDADRDRCGIYLGSTSFELGSEFFGDAVLACRDHAGGISAERMARVGGRQIDPLLIIKSLPNAALSGIAIEHSLRGPALNLANGSASGLQAVIAACGAIGRRECAVAVTGGADSQLLAQDAIERGSAVPPGEGAAILVVESVEHATTRGAWPLAEMVAFAERSGPRGNPSHENHALAGAIRCCLDRAGLRPPDIVFADGIGDPDRDLGEILALARECEKAVAVTSAAGAIGCTGAASGAFSLCHAVESLRRGRLPPTLGQRFERTEGADVARRARSGNYRSALVVNSDRAVKSSALLIQLPVVGPQTRPTLESG